MSSRVNINMLMGILVKNLFFSFRTFLYGNIELNVRNNTFSIHFDGMMTLLHEIHLEKDVLCLKYESLV